MKIRKFFVEAYDHEARKYLTLSSGFRSREMAVIEMRVLEAMPENDRLYITVRERMVTPEAIEVRRLETYGESNYAERKIFDAIAEYQRCNEW